MNFFSFIVAFVVVSCIVYSPASAFQSNNAGFRINSQLSMSSVARNENFAKLQAGYLFPEIGRRRNAYLAEHPDAKIISLGIGDTTLPIPEHILSGLKDGAAKLGTKSGYSGYGAEQGTKELREKIASKLYNNMVAPDEVFVSDGAKCDISRLMMMFGAKVVSAVQDPSYPVYVDTSVMMGQTGEMDPATSQFKNIVYMPCNPENNFFPDITKLPRADVYYFCSPNNPTGAVATRAQLEGFVKYAKENGSIIVFDAAYAPFIRSPGMAGLSNSAPSLRRLPVRRISTSSPHPCIFLFHICMIASCVQRSKVELPSRHR